VHSFNFHNIKQPNCSCTIYVYKAPQHYIMKDVSLNQHWTASLHFYNEHSMLVWKTAP